MSSSSEIELPSGHRRGITSKFEASKRDCRGDRYHKNENPVSND